MKGNTDYFEKSVLFKAVLKGEEVRYSDLIRYFIENSRSFSKKISGIPIAKVYREKKNSDIWISRIENISKGLEPVELPIVLIENKFQSFPTKHQLAEYTKSFLSEAITSFKRKIREKIRSENANTKKKKTIPINGNIIKDYLTDLVEYLFSLKFYLLIPFEEAAYGLKKEEYCFKSNNDWYKDAWFSRNWFRENINSETCYNIRDEIENFYNDGEFVFTWTTLSYSGISEMLDNSDVDDFKSEETYFTELRNDFIQLLHNFNELYKVLGNLRGNMKLSNAIDKGSDRFKSLRILPLHNKIRASQLANILHNEISRLYNPDQYLGIIVPWNLDLIKNGQLLIHHSYSALGHNGLFEVIKRQSKNLLYIIQVEGTVLKKAIIVENNNNIKYHNWLKRSWQVNSYRKLKFSLKDTNDDGDSYKYKVSSKYTFYYSYSEVGDFTINDIIKIMSHKIQTDYPRKLK